MARTEYSLGRLTFATTSWVAFLSLLPIGCSPNPIGLAGPVEEVRPSAPNSPSNDAGNTSPSSDPENIRPQEGAQRPVPVPSLWTRQAGEDWPRMLGVRFDSRSSEKGIRTDWGNDGLKVVWSQKTGVGYGNGVAAHGRWLQFDRYGDSERLSCYRAATGEFLWKWESKVTYRDAYGYNDGPRCSPIVDGEYVYVYGVAGKLTCLRLVDGKEQWSRDTGSEYSVVPNFFGVGAAPLVYGDLLLVMVGGSPKPSAFARSPTVNDLPSAKPNGSGMVAFDKRTGKEVYRVGDYLASYSAPIIAQLEGKDHCLAVMREGLMVFRPEDGQGVQFFPWRAAMLESVNAASPVVFDDRIFISEAYEIGSAMLQWKSGTLEPLWKDTGGRSNQAMRTHWATPLFDKNMLYASSGRNPPDTDLRCIDIAPDGSPKVRWSQRNRDRGTGLLVDGHFLWLGENGRLQLIPLGAEKYTVISEMNLQLISDPNDKQPLINPPSWAPPVLSHGLLYVRGSDRVVCLELIPQ